VKVLYLFIGFTGIIVGVISLSPWMVFVAVRHAANARKGVREVTHVI
jgi:hypothetical protein